MEKIKEMIDQGDLELATMNGDKHEQMQYSDLKQKVDFRNHASSISKSLDFLSTQQRKKWIDQKKAKAGSEFNSGNFSVAIQIYLQSLVGIDYSIQNIRQDYQYPILLNMATCYYHQGDYAKGVALCDSILKEKENHSLGNFKKGCLLIKLGEYDQAIHCFEKAKKQSDAKLRSSIDIQLNLVKKYKGAESSMYKNMFAAEKEESTSGQEEEIGFNSTPQNYQASETPMKMSFIQKFISLLCPRRSQNKTISFKQE